MIDQAARLELLVDRLERDVDEWRRLSYSDLESLVNDQLAHLAAQMHEAHLATQEAAKAIFPRFEILGDEESRTLGCHRCFY